MFMAFLLGFSRCLRDPYSGMNKALADPGGGGGGNPPLKNNVKGFNPKYKIISWEWCYIYGGGGGGGGGGIE